MMIHYISGQILTLWFCCQKHKSVISRYSFIYFSVPMEGQNTSQRSTFSSYCILIPLFFLYDCFIRSSRNKRKLCLQVKCSIALLNSLSFISISLFVFCVFILLHYEIGSSVLLLFYSSQHTEGRLISKLVDGYLNDVCMYSSILYTCSSPSYHWKQWQQQYILLVVFYEHSEPFAEVSSSSLAFGTKIFVFLHLPLPPLPAKVFLASANILSRTRPRH